MRVSRKINTSLHPEEKTDLKDMGSIPVMLNGKKATLEDLDPKFAYNVTVSRSENDNIPVEVAYFPQASRLGTLIALRREGLEDAELYELGVYQIDAEFVGRRK